MARKQTRAWIPKHNKMHLGSLSRRMLFIWFMLAGLILLFAPQEFTSKFQLAFVRIFRWPLSVGGNFSLTARTQQPLNNVSNRSQTQYLNYIASLEETLSQQRKEFEKLYGLYNEYIWEGVGFVLADVITANIDGLRNELTIDCRENIGLIKGQFVLGDNSIIGTISDVSSRTAHVKLFTDPTSSIAVKIGKLDINRIMHGNGKNSAKIPLVSIEHKINIGDNVFARKKSKFLDAPVKIGKVTELKRDDKNPLFWDITVEPACDIEKLEDVAVIIMNPQQ
ncbi:MAG: rod shape-determining protein MreC [Planctomycetota bacterium]